MNKQVDNKQVEVQALEVNYIKLLDEVKQIQQELAIKQYQIASKIKEIVELGSKLNKNKSSIITDISSKMSISTVQVYKYLSVANSNIDLLKEFDITTSYAIVQKKLTADDARKDKIEVTKKTSTVQELVDKLVKQIKAYLKDDKKGGLLKQELKNLGY